MEIEILTIILDILVIFGFSVYHARKIKNTLSEVSGIVFVSTIVIGMVRVIFPINLELMLGRLENELLTLIPAIILGYVSGFLALALFEPIKKLLSRIMRNQ